MKKTKYYYDTRFPVNVLEDAHNLFLSKQDADSQIERPFELEIEVNDEAWNFDNLEEFLAEYPKAKGFSLYHRIHKNIFHIYSEGTKTCVNVTFSARHSIEDVFRVFERNLDSSRITINDDPVKVFIGHGRDSQWKYLKDHLQDSHGFDIVAYEIGPRAGLSVKDVLQDMLNNSSFALLVLTSEDQHSDGEWHARENVIHELGLFQGKLGFTRAIALLEDGTKEFSNILGINQIRFSQGNIRETFGDILATIKREMQ